MIRILHIVTHMNRGGLETMIMNYYRHIDREKIQFDFLVHREYESDYDEEIKGLGGRIYHISKLIPWSQSYKKELRDFFLNHKEYKIIHVHQDCLSSVILQVAEDCGVPVRIAHSHSKSQDKNLKYVFKVYYKRFIKKYATDLFACGREAGEWMFGTSDFLVLNNAIDVRAYEPDQIIREKVRTEFGITGEQFLIGHVGRFSPAKNHHFIIDVFREIKEREENARLILVGVGEKQEEIQELVRQTGLEKDVIFAGLRADVNQLMQAMDVFLFPSLYEGLPVTLVEAQAAGLTCIISSNVPKECILTRGLVRVKGLSEPLGVWADAVIGGRNVDRCSHYQEIKEKGFDILSNAEELERFYLSKNTVI